MSSDYDIEHEEVVSYVTEEGDDYIIEGKVIITYKGKKHEICFAENYTKEKKESESSIVPRCNHCSSENQTGKHILSGHVCKKRLDAMNKLKKENNR